MSPGLVTVQIEILAHGRGLPMPRYETDGAAGLDLRAALDAPVTLAPMGRALIPTGLKLAIPEGYEGQVRARSGLAARHGIGLPNAPGTIDSDYRGELMVLVINWGPEPYAIARGDRIAQLVIAPVVRAVLEPVLEVPPTVRDRGGFGHTGER